MRELKSLPSIINNVEVLEDLGMNNQKPKKRIAKFKCECGNTFVAKVNAVKVGHRRSCGCARDGKPTHGLSGHPLYRKWSGMITRTTNSKELCYPRYGGRGITVCPEWRNDFMAFYNWAMRNGWELGLTIDRINNDGNYEPDNCQWLTMHENTIKDSIKFRPTEKQEADICALYVDDKFTVTAISKLFHTYAENISKLLKKHNIKIVHRRMKK